MGVDSENHAIRWINRHTGIIMTVAGTLCEKGFAGDGGLATMAKMNHPAHAAFDPDTHDLLIADYMNAVIRRVDMKSGRITTIAGMPGGMLQAFAVVYFPLGCYML